MKSFMKTIISAIKYWVDNKVDDISKRAVQPDWEQNDPNSPDYIKRKPFYSYSDKYYLIKDVSIGAGSSVSFDTPLPIDDSKTYTVKLSDGRVFESPAYFDDADGANAIQGIEVEKDAWLSIGRDYAYWSGSYDIEFSVEGFVDFFKGLDEKYIPNSFVKFTEPQNLKSAEMERATSNIGAVPNSWVRGNSIIYGSGSMRTVGGYRVVRVTPDSPNNFTIKNGTVVVIRENIKNLLPGDRINKTQLEITGTGGSNALIYMYGKGLSEDNLYDSVGTGSVPSIFMWFYNRWNLLPIVLNASKDRYGLTRLTSYISQTDEGYVPSMDLLRSVANSKISVPETAEVGQTIVVSEVDENGKPTAWEAVDMSSNSGAAVTVDSEMSDTSSNPVQNKVVKAYIDSVVSGSWVEVY